MINYRKILQENELYKSNEIPRTNDMTHFQELEDAFAESGGGYFVGLVNYEDELTLITNDSGKIIRYIIDPDTYPHYEDNSRYINNKYFEMKDLAFKLSHKFDVIGEENHAIARCGVWHRGKNIGSVYVAIDPKANNTISRITDDFLNNDIEITEVKDGDIKVRIDEAILYGDDDSW